MFDIARAFTASNSNNYTFNRMKRLNYCALIPQKFQSCKQQSKNRYNSVIIKKTGDYLLVSFSPKLLGMIPFFEISNDPDTLSNIENNYKYKKYNQFRIGQNLKTRIIKIDKERNMIIGSLLEKEKVFFILEVGI